MIGFGHPSEPLDSDRWLSKSKKTEEDRRRAIQELGRKYKYPGHVSNDVLDALGIGVLVSSDRTQEYQTSGRLMDAEETIQAQIRARASNFGDSHLSQAKCESELSKILQAQLRFEEAEKHEIRASGILRNHFGDRHPSALMGNVTLAYLYAKQGLLRKAHRLSRETQPILEEVLGLEHPEAISALQVHGIIQYELGLAKEAEQSMRKVIDVRTKILTGAHPFTVRAELSLVSVLRAQGRLTESKELTASISERLVNQLAGDYLSKAELYIVWGALESETGSLDQALLRVTEGLAAMDMLRLPATDPLRLDGLEILTSIYGKLNERQKQEEILRQILDVKKSQDRRNREIATTMCLLAGCLLAQNRWEDASALADKVLTASDRSVAEDPQNYVTAVDIMANAASYRGQNEEAERQRQDLLRACKSDLGEGNRFTLDATCDLGAFYTDQGQHQKAQHLYEQAIAQIETETQPGNTLIKLQRLLAVALTEQGRFQEAESVCLTGIDQALQAVGDRHITTLALYNALGRIYILTGKYEEADELYATKLQEQSVGTEADIYVLEHMAVLRRCQQRIPEAMDLKRRSEVLMKSILGENRPEYINMQGNVLSDHMADPELFTPDVERDVMANIHSKKVLFGARHPSTISTMCDLAYAYLMKDRIVEADAIFKELSDSIRQVKSPDKYAKILGKRADVCFRLERLDEAERFEREALAVRRSIFDEDNVAVLTNKSNLASTLSAQGRHPEAEELLREVVAGRERTPQGNSQSVFSLLKARTALGAVLYYQGKYEDSAPYYASSVEVARKVGLPAQVVNGWQTELDEVLENMVQVDGEVATEGVGT
ncbi:hypothetical protein PV05_03844 [Exophiala xenobiotica]|uniref:Uncharacterized protein n=1 Tax=Exophiala xenobiotica TaxID=348802 RepID=A0A0D2C3I5_9EURO|nr:uncharacterized protein PV05_03844 [Exophiala xenobiotica]KIW59391.1 hypothetical protein PV05_03844 [Exophiala xenobiotica]